MSTEGELGDWRRGQIVAERLCAEILALEGFNDIDPQAPLGGPDDKKDILARRDGLLWVAAVFFPPTRQAFAAIRGKFADDLEGVARHDAGAFAFFVNQRLTPGQRDELIASADVPVEIYHLERLRSILDRPLGYGLRVQFLQIPMTVEEQASFVLDLATRMSGRAQASETELVQLRERVDEVLARTTIIGGLLAQTPSSVVQPAPVAISTAPTAALTAEMLSFIHRLVAPNALFPGLLGEELRPVDVQIGEPDKPIFVPPSAEELPARIDDYIRWWRMTYPGLLSANRESVIDELAKLHHGFLSIHPFLDGNGRVARALLDQAARELLGQTTLPALTADPNQYFATLRAADEGDLVPLRDLIRDSLH